MTDEYDIDNKFRGWPIWSVQVNDLVGGWIVTTYPYSLSHHDHGVSRVDFEPIKCGYTIADCITEDDARRIAQLLNEERYVPTMDDTIAKNYRWVRAGYIPGTLRLSLYEEDYLL